MIDIPEISSKPYLIFCPVQKRTFHLVSEQSHLQAALEKAVALFVCSLSPLNEGLSPRLGKAVVPEVDLFAL